MDGRDEREGCLPGKAERGRERWREGRKGSLQDAERCREIIVH